MSTTFFHISTSYSHNVDVGPVIPALLIKISILDFFVILLVQFSTSLKFETSTIFELKFGLFKSLRAISTILESVSQMMTLAPESKNLLVISRPKPCAPPVTTAVLLLKL